MQIQVGQQAPDFSLYDSAKNKVTLSEQKGKNVLLLFFPRHLPAYVQQNSAVYAIILPLTIMPMLQYSAFLLTPFLRWPSLKKPSNTIFRC